MVFSVFLIGFLLCSCKQEQSEDIYILYTNDVASNLDANMGYAGVKGYKDYLKSENRYVALVDAGDFFDGTISSKSKGEYIVEIMNAVGYDVVALGNQEFSIGLDALSENISKSDFDYVSCNLRYTGLKNNPLQKVKAYTIKKYGPVKIAYIGVTTPETLIKGKPSYEAIIEDGELIYDFYEGNRGYDLYERVQSIVDEVRDKADYVIVLAHLGSNSTRDGFSSYDLIANTSGIDVVIDGHSHTVIEGEAVENKNGEEVILTSTGEKLQNLGILRLCVDHTIYSGLMPTVYETDESIVSLVSEIYSKAGN
ncbi:MAG: metallophosphatase [Erysipelotrichaceae bacterium]|nr:metallophosphatase [Erysipelotrichaceae bacterium]